MQQTITIILLTKAVSIRFHFEDPHIQENDIVNVVKLTPANVDL